MGQQLSKDELLYQKAIDGDIHSVKALSSDGAGLEWIDKEGKTPLIAACMNPQHYIVAKTLIEIGANVNAYCAGRHAGTPLHHAAKSGLDGTVWLLLSHGANLFVRKDDYQTPLDVARVGGFTNVVRLIEGHICFFSGWLREFYGPGFLEVLAPKLLSRQIYTVVIPYAQHNPAKPLKLDLAIYSNFQDAQPRAVVPLWKADIEEPKPNLQDPKLIIFDKPTGTRYRFAASNDGDKQQIQSFYHACRGISQVMHIPSTQTAKKAEFAMAVNASLQSGIDNKTPPQSNHYTHTSKSDNLNGWENSKKNTTHNEWGPSSDPSPPAKASSSSSSSDWIDEQTKEQPNGWGQKPDNRTQTPKPDNFNGWANSTNNTNHNGWGCLVGESSLIKASNLIDKCQVNFISSPPQSSEGVNEMSNGWGVPVQKSPEHNTEVTYMPQLHIVPSAPPIPIEGLDEGLIKYPSIEKVGIKSEVKKEEEGLPFCVICWEAPVEGACVPCGHMAGCMACLDEVKNKKGDCPVCRSKIDQIIRIYAV